MIKKYILLLFVVLHVGCTHQILCLSSPQQDQKSVVRNVTKVGFYVSGMLVCCVLLEGMKNKFDVMAAGPEIVIACTKTCAVGLFLGAVYCFVGKKLVRKFFREKTIEAMQCVWEQIHIL